MTKKRIQIGWTWITASGYRTISAKYPRHVKLQKQASPVYMYQDSAEPARRQVKS